MIPPLPKVFKEDGFVVAPEFCNPVELSSEAEVPMRLSRLALGSDLDIEAEHDSGVGWAQSCFWLSARRQSGEAG